LQDLDVSSLDISENVATSNGVSGDKLVVVTSTGNSLGATLVSSTDLPDTAIVLQQDDAACPLAPQATEEILNDAHPMVLESHEPGHPTHNLEDNNLTVTELPTQGESHPDAAMAESFFAPFLPPVNPSILPTTPPRMPTGPRIPPTSAEFMSLIFNTEQYLADTDGTPQQDRHTFAEPGQMSIAQIDKMFAEQLPRISALVPGIDIDVNMQLDLPHPDLPEPPIMMIKSLVQKFVNSRMDIDENTEQAGPSTRMDVEEDPVQVNPAPPSSQTFNRLHQSLRTTIPLSPSQVLPPELPASPLTHRPPPQALSAPASPSPITRRQKLHLHKPNPEIPRKSAPNPISSPRQRQARDPSPPRPMATNALDTSPPPRQCIQPMAPPLEVPRHSTCQSAGSIARDENPRIINKVLHIAPKKQVQKCAPAKAKTVLEGSLVSEIEQMPNILSSPAAPVRHSSSCSSLLLDALADGGKTTHNQRLFDGSSLHCLSPHRSH
jgi:hypothetical protein